MKVYILLNDSGCNAIEDVFDTMEKAEKYKSNYSKEDQEYMYIEEREVL